MAPRAGGKKSATVAVAPPNPEMEERQKLKKLAYNNNIVSDKKVESSVTLNPSKTVMKHHGKDILRKSQRKNRFLFSFPGLIGPVNGGKIGDLVNLGTKNPILYLDFPQGQMKLFGTIVYPKTRYLTLQFSRGGKNVMCEDYFDNMVFVGISTYHTFGASVITSLIVFSDAWWIGRKEENPEELQLEFPKELNIEKHAECDFKGGAGGACKENNEKFKSTIKLTEQHPAKHESDLEDNSCDSLQYSNETMDVDQTPKRHSARTAGKTFRFAEGSSGDDFIDNDVDMSEEEDEKVDAKHPIRELSRKITDIDEGDQLKPAFSKQAEKATKSILKAKGVSNSNRGPLVQATISTLFKKVENKVGEPIEKGSLAGGKRTGRKTTRQEGETETEDDIEEFSSSPQDTDGSDEDFAE